MSDKQLDSRTIQIKSVDALNRSGNDTFNNFEVDLSTSLALRDQAASITVHGVNLPNTCYNVNQYTNVLVWTESDAGGSNTDTYTLTVPPNEYTAAQLATYLSTNMSAYSAGGGGGTYNYTITWAVSYDTQSRKMTFTATDGINGINVLKFDTHSHMVKLLGFKAGSSATVVSNTTPATSLYVVGLNACLRIAVHMSGYGQGQSSEAPGTTNDVLFMIDAGRGGFGDVIVHDPTVSSNEVHTMYELFTTQRIYLTTDYGNGLGSKPYEGQSHWEFALHALTETATGGDTFKHKRQRLN